MARRTGSVITMTVPEAQALARAVRYRRLELGYDPMRAWPDDARLSQGLIRKVESGRYTNLHENTLIKLELDLGWTKGSVERVWAGGEPTTVGQTA